MMDDYIQGNKSAWEEAFDHRSADWGSDIIARVANEAYPFFNAETIHFLRKYDLSGKTVGQFCSNNGRETLSLVKSGGAMSGIGFDIAENQVAFANNCARKLALPCKFVATSIYDIAGYDETFDFSLITIGALCWFRDLDELFGVIARTMKKGSTLLINESHPVVNMLAMEDDPEYDIDHPQNIVFSYFEHEWRNNQGMHYMAGESYASKTFIDYTHSLSEIISTMCKNGIVITDFQEFDHDIGVGCTNLDGKRIPLSMIIEGRKQ